MDFERNCDCGLCDTLVPNNNPKIASKIHKDFFATIHAKLNIASSGFCVGSFKYCIPNITRDSHTLRNNVMKSTQRAMHARRINVSKFGNDRANFKD